MLEGMDLAAFSYPRTVCVAVVFWTLTVMFVRIMFAASGVTELAVEIVSGLSALMAVVLTFKAYRHRRVLNQVMTIEMLRIIAPGAFEHYVSVLLKRIGYVRVHICGGARDRGVDLIAYRHGQKIAFQCKRYAAGHKVTSAEMQTFVGAVKIGRASGGLFITTSTYTPESKAIAAQEGIVLIDEAKLAAMIDGSRHGSFVEGGCATLCDASATRQL
jgi:HJR/Mrr/RecB family endonuclease